MDTRHLLQISTETHRDGVVELQLRPGRLTWLPHGRERMISPLHDTGALMVYADGVDDAHIGLQQGAIRDDFDFGPVVMIRGDVFSRCVGDLDPGLRGAVLCSQLMIQRMGKIVHIPEASTRSTPLPRLRGSLTT